MNRPVFFLIMAWLASSLAGCTFQGDVYKYITQVTENTATTDTDPSVDTDVPIVSPVIPSVASAEASFNIFDHAQTGTVMWIDVSPETLASMNRDWQNGGFGGGGFFGGVYSVDETFSVTLSDHFYVQLPDDSATDYTQIEVSLAGQSTGTIWDATTIPNFNLDFDQVVDGMKLGGKYEHLRLNNGQVGSMYGESTALAVYAELGYPVPRTNYVLLGGRTWGEADKLIPYLSVEKYKKSWCNDHAAQLGGGCKNIWEGYGIDISKDTVMGFDQACDTSSCDTTRLKQFADVVTENMGTQEFEEATEPYFDWPMYQQFQCTQWLLWIGDDPLHNFNNIVLLEGMDGKFRYEPYSTDISAGMAWGGAYSNIPLYGMNALSVGCQQDESCWSETIATCEGVIAKFTTINPASIVDEERNRLQNIKYPWGDDGGDGALRPPDATFYTLATSFYSTRATNALAELDLYRAPQESTDTGAAKDTDPAQDTDLVVIPQFERNRSMMLPKLWKGLDPKKLPIAYPNP